MTTWERKMTLQDFSKLNPLTMLCVQIVSALEQEQYHSIDKKMVPTKTKGSGICQYLPKKIRKWGFKNFVPTDASRIIYNFFFYAGQKSAVREKCGASEVVFQPVEEIPKNQNFQLFMDNWFSTLPLLWELKTMGILSIATFHSNCLGGCPLMFEKDLKKRSRGLFNYRTDYNSGTHLLKWYDNKCVVGSSFAGVECTNAVGRYDLAQKKKAKSTVLTWSLSITDQWVGLIWLICWLPFPEPKS